MKGESERAEKNLRACWLQVCWFWLILLSSMSQLSVGIRRASQRGGCCQTASKQQDELNGGTKEGQKRIARMKGNNGEQRLRRPVCTFSSSSLSCEGLKGCCRSSVFFSGIHNPISASVEGGVLQRQWPICKNCYQ